MWAERWRRCRWCRRHKLSEGTGPATRLLSIATTIVELRSFQWYAQQCKQAEGMCCTLCTQEGRTASAPLEARLGMISASFPSLQNLHGDLLGFQHSASETTRKLASLGLGLAEGRVLGSTQRLTRLPAVAS